MSAARGSCRRLLAVAAILGVAGAARAARADEPADRGMSLSVSVGAAVDHSVTAIDSGRPVNETAPIVGALGLGNIEHVAIGGAVDATPATLGNGRLSVSALLGYQQQIGHTRLHVLGEAGRHRFSEVGGTLLGRQLGPDVWMPYAGLRLGAARTVPEHGLFQAGVSLFARYDLEQVTVTHVSDFMGDETRTDYRLGGLTAGVAVQVGMFLESPHPWNQGVVEE
jgi:hypothetical protein